MRELNSKKANFNNQDFSKINVNEYCNYEYLYFRSMSINHFNVTESFPKLRVIDVSSNNLSNLKFLENMPNICHVFASRNKIKSFKDIFIGPKLESLSISSNLIQSFYGLKNSNTLSVLTAIGNMIHNFEFFPKLKKLQTIDLRGNPISETNLLSPLLISTLQGESKMKMKKIKGLNINGNTVTKKDIEFANELNKKLKKLIILGYIPSEDYGEEEMNDFIEWKSREYTKTRRSPLLLSKVGFKREAREGKKIIFTPIFIQKPNEAHKNSRIKTMKNYAYHTFRLTCKNRTVNLFIDGKSIKMNKFETLSEHFATLFAIPGTYAYRYGWGGKVEKNNRTVEIIDTVGKSTEEEDHDDYDYILRLKWFRDEQIIEEANELFYEITKEDVGSLLRAEMILNDFVTGDEICKVFSITNAVLPALPSISNIKIIGEPIEGRMLTCSYDYTGGKEGKSLIQFYREGNEEEKYQDKYSVTIADSERKIICEITPIRNDGIKGDTIKISTDFCKASTPFIKNVEITGDMKNGEKLRIMYDYYGGIERDTEFKWIRIDPLTNENEEIEEARNQNEYILQMQDVGSKISIFIIPKNTKNELGETIESKREEPVEPKEPKIANLKIKGKWKIGKTIKCKYEYEGGIEGNSIINWFKKREGTNDYLMIKENSNGFKLTEDEIGYIIGFDCLPIRIDGMKGEAQRYEYSKTFEYDHKEAPVCSFIQLKGLPMEDNILTVEAEYEVEGEIEEGDSIYKWYRLDKTDNKESFPKKDNDTTYNCTVGDVGCKLIAEYIPITKDGRKGISYFTVSETVLPSMPVFNRVSIDYQEPIEGNVFEGLAEYHGGTEDKSKRIHQWYRMKGKDLIKIFNATKSTYTAQYEDVDCQLVYGSTPIRTDGTVGAMAKSEQSPVIRPLLPKIVGLKLIGSLAEGKLIELSIIEYDSKTSKKPIVPIDKYRSTVEWYIVEKNGFEMKIEEGKFFYTPKNNDIGKKIKLRFVPCRKDTDLFGKETILFTNDVITDAQPVAKYAFISGKFCSGEKIIASVKYSGGKEGKSKYAWYRVDPIAGTEELIKESTGEGVRSLLLTEKEANHKIKLVYTPVRFDGIEGEKVEAISTLIKAAAPKIRKIELIGNLVSGEKISYKFDSANAKQNKSSKRWYRVLDQGKIELAALNVDEYELKDSDVGCFMRLVYTPVTSDGIRGRQIEVNSTSKVLPSFSV